MEGREGDNVVGRDEEMRWWMDEMISRRDGLVGSYWRAGINDVERGSRLLSVIDIVILRCKSGKKRKRHPFIDTANTRPVEPMMQIRKCSNLLSPPLPRPPLTRIVDIIPQPIRIHLEARDVMVTGQGHLRRMGKPSCSCRKW